MDEDVKGLIGHFRQIELHASNLLGLLQNIDSSTHATRSEVDSILAEYSDARINFERIRQAKKLQGTLRHISPREFRDRLGNVGVGVGELMGALREVMMQCGKALATLNSLVAPLSEQEVDKLNQIRDELKKLPSLPSSDSYLENLEAAITEYELGHHLASALISSRVVVYSLSKVPGKEDNDRIKYLEERGVIPKERSDVTQGIVKASRRSRNFLSHDIQISATPKDSLALIGDAVKITEMVGKLHQKAG